MGKFAAHMRRKAHQVGAQPYSCRCREPRLRAYVRPAAHKLELHLVCDLREHGRDLIVTFWWIRPMSTPLRGIAQGFPLDFFGGIGGSGLGDVSDITGKISSRGGGSIFGFLSSERSPSKSKVVVANPNALRPGRLCRTR